MSEEFVGNFWETLSVEQKNFLFGVINLNIYGLELSWDFDQVFMMSEVPVLDFVDKDKGTHYLGRRIKGWNSVAKWLTEDKIMFGKEADDYENWVWTEPKIIKEARPNKRLQALSFVAAQRGIKQSISTARPPKLASVTYAQVEMYYPWLKDNVNQCESESIPLLEFKVGKIMERAKMNPNLVHLDDSMSCMRKILMLRPNTDVIGFPAPEDPHGDLVGGRRIFFPDLSTFESLINCSPWIND